MSADLLARLTWIKHASFLYAGSLRIAFDPWAVTLDTPVDLVLVTHGHYDHCDPETVVRILKAEATVIASASCTAELNGNVRPLAVGGVSRVGDVTITATEAYNTTKPYHPRGEGVGFLVAVDGGTIFHAGDTDDIPETHGLAPDVALLPVGGKYTMDVDEAVGAARAIGAAVSIPMHYGYIVGSPEDGPRFTLALGEKAAVLKPRVAFGH